MPFHNMDVCYAEVNMEEIFQLSENIVAWNEAEKQDQTPRLDASSPTPPEQARRELTQADASPASGLETYWDTIYGSAPSLINSDAITPSEESQNSSLLQNINPSARTPGQACLDGTSDLWASLAHIYAQEAFHPSLGDWPHAAVHVSEFLGSEIPKPSILWGSENLPSLEWSIRDELVRVYFTNIHPLCPIIDEHNFYEHYFGLGGASFLGMFPSMLFNAMIFAALAHVTEDQLHRTGFSTVCAAQEAYYTSLKDIYDSAGFQASSEIDELILAKTCLLLSFWCGRKLDVAVNSLWVDRAIHHTKQYLRKSRSLTSRVMPKRRDILYWCCISRNILISYAMRRPHRLHIEDEFLCTPDDVRSEFDREVLFHNFSSPQAKLQMIEDFVTMCKLSMNLSSILKSQRIKLFHKQWNLGNTTSEQDDLHENLTNYLETANYEADILQLIGEYEKSRKLSLQIGEGGEEASEELLGKLRSYTISLIAQSSIATLYQFALVTTPGSWARSCQRTGLVKVREASTKVARIAEHLLNDVSSQSIPGTLLCWTILPVVTFLVEEQCRQMKLPQLIEGIEPNTHHHPRDDRERFQVHEVEKLLELAYTLAPRFQSAREHWHLMQVINKLIHSAATSKQIMAMQKHSERQGAPRPSAEQAIGAGSTSQGAGDVEAVDLELLNGAIGYLDRCVAYGGELVT